MRNRSRAAGRVAKIEDANRRRRKPVATAAGAEDRGDAATEPGGGNAWRPQS
ncbi:hypothetical protein [Myceligenerans pegani]|uniref:Uncharacterized protein n=1 Tax=Myceligenerans pegani TaxID=2776917 RepID=A0ABR9MS07_9MICO|nr:hypothetical protein [Myceligenerans sp. TRM 65318]MBE1874172.1 hypothetical protein [Myceligenerans sp. TRM 65318]MBE3016444.1 hypothetical protein [Myceligenerans sp. TRM 65318]